jgi:hypothetical protein
MHPTIVSYYTPNSAYERHAYKLKRSLGRLGLESIIEPREARHSWVENCAQKAEYVQEIRRKIKRPILWVDADAIMQRPFYELCDCPADLAVVKRQGWNFSGGQIYFGPGTGADLIIDIWADYCRKYPHVWDQVSLGYAWWDAVLTTEISALWLDDSVFLKLERRFFRRIKQRLAGSAAVFLHRQESGRSRRKQGKPDVDVFKSRSLPMWWREAAQKNAPFMLTREQRLELGLD